MLCSRVSHSRLQLRRVAFSAPILRPLTCYATAEATPEAATTSVKVNEVYSGKVTGIKANTAFVTLDNQVKGSLHVSMISRERVETVEDVFAVGDELK
ncbi:30S ribosomal protein S1, partial [Haematococcus lacustris]